MAAKKANYQTLKTELDSVMSALQNQDLDVDAAIKYYERGLDLVVRLEAYLKTAENRVKKLKTGAKQPPA